MEYKAWEHRNSNDFFEAYAQAMTQQDTRLMTRFYELPCTLMSDGMATAFTEPNRLEGMFNQGMSYYLQLGIRHFRAELWSQQPVNAHYTRVKICWHYATEDGTAAYSSFYEYILYRDRAGFVRIQVSIALDERARLSAWQEDRKPAETPDLQ